MKKICVLALTVAIAFAVVFTLSLPAHAQSAADLYKSKCAMCHGPDGAGKMKGTPDFRTAEFQKKTDAELTSAIANGPNGKESHAFSKKGLDDATIKSLVAFIRTLKK